MEKLIEDFGVQLEKALEIGENINLTDTDRKFTNVVIAGMGGSGIGGTIVSELASEESKLPILVSKTYSLGMFVGEKTLFIASSYSGNTEETLSALDQALAKGAKVVCIASGGKLIEKAKEKGLDHAVIPSDVIAEGVSSPRAAIGYSLVQLLYILNGFGFISDKFKQEINSAIKLIRDEHENIKTLAENIASKMLGKFPVVYAPSGSEGIAVRFKQQLNENSKMLAWYNVIPEMNHNELLGWEGGTAEVVAFIFRNQTDHPRISERIEFSKGVISEHTPHIVELYSKGRNAIERAIYHIHTTDYVSVYLAKLRKVDPNDLAVIEELKKVLASK